MPMIGVSELHAHASKVLRDVRDHGTRYVITKRGKPAAILLPLPLSERSGGAESSDNAAWDRFWEVSERIRRSWKSPLTDEEIMKEIRR